MKKADLSFCVFILVAFVGIYPFNPAIASDANEIRPKQLQTICVKKWDAVSAAEVNIPKLTKAEVLAEVEKYVNAHKALRSWESEFNVTWRQATFVTYSPSLSGQPKSKTIPEVTRKTETRIISNGSKWIYQSTEENEDKSSNRKYGLSSCYTSNGRIITMLQPEQKNAHVWEAEKWNRIPGTTTIVDFMPWLTAQSMFMVGEHSPDFNDILTSQDTKLLPWYTMVNDHICYVLELVLTGHHPLFKTPDELDNWKREHPKEVDEWSKLKNDGWFLCDTSAKSGDLRTVKVTKRLVIDPKSGFAIVRWAKGLESETPRIRTSLFPQNEIIYRDFQGINKEIYSPREMTYTEYTLTGEGHKNIQTETTLHITRFVIDKTYPPEIFETKIPEGYSITDVDKGIVYTAGDSNETLAALLAGVRARDIFYAKLSEGPAPFLEASQWFNTKPISLSDYTGRDIILHFWSIGCRPCVHELPRLQEQYGPTLKSSSGPLFISIHPFAEGKNLEQLKEMIKKYGITFPVMVDSGGDKQWPIGKTHKKYRNDAWPTNIKIDPNGHFAGFSEKVLINTSSRWIVKPYS